MTEPHPPPAPLVLYVDDERGNRIVFEQSLGSEFNLKTAVDAADALGVMEHHEVAVLVTDMRMPVMSGEDLLRVVKQRWPLAIRMVVTAFADIDPILAAINEGLVARYIVKPWDHDELLQVLRWATETWALGRDFAAVQRRLLETERLATLGSVSGMLVHDLKQPLMSLSMNAELLSELAEYAPMLRARVGANPAANLPRITELIDSLAQITGDVRISVDHLNELISSLRGFMRPRRDGAVLATDPIPIVKHAISACQELGTSAIVAIEYLGPPALPLVRIARTELTQVLINLISNAGQAVAARGLETGKVSIHAHEDGAGMLVFEVRDDGIGMSAEVLRRLGTPFFTTREEGTGLGVANCQRLIGAAGGRMKIESELGVGTTVTIMVPISAS